MDKDKVKSRMKELMEIIDRSIQMTDDTSELLMLACAMLQRTDEIFIQTLSPKGSLKMFEDLVNEKKNRLK